MNYAQLETEYEAKIEDFEIKYSTEEMRTVLREELLETISRSSSDALLTPERGENDPPPPSNQRNRPPTATPTATPKSNPPPPRQQKQAANRPSSQASSLYDGDGYEPTALEGREKLNRDVLQAVRRLAPQHIDVFARRFSSEAFANRTMRMQARERQDRAANFADLINSSGPAQPAPSPAREPATRPLPTQYESRLEILRIMHQKVSADSSRQLGPSSSDNGRRPGGPGLSISNLIEQIKRLQGKSEATPPSENIVISPNSARPSFTPSLTVTAPAVPLPPSFAYPLEDWGSIDPSSAPEQDNASSTSVGSKSGGGVTPTQEHNSRSTSPSSECSDETVIYRGPTTFPIAQTETPSIEIEASLITSCASGSSSNDSSDSPGDKEPGGRDSSDSDGDEGGDGDGDGDRGRDKGEDADKSDDEGEDDKDGEGDNEDEDEDEDEGEQNEDEAKEDSAETESNEDPTSFRVFDETFASYRHEDARYHDSMVLRRWVDVLDWWAD
ncbi:hypothetical protein PMIN03_002524 [Paraphaeosphaeria minitans]